MLGPVPTSMAKRNHLNRELADGIRQVGFRKWYERELLSGHAHMVLALLAAIGIMGSFEAFRGAPVQEKVMDVVFIIICGAIGVWSIRRYLYLLGHAEQVANQADCPQCKTYGRFEVVAEDARLNTVQVRCKKCRHEWTIEE